MLATLNSRQIVDEIVKDTMKDNDPHDAVQISPDVVRASRASTEAPNLAPEIAGPAKPTIDLGPGVPRMAAPSVDTAIRVAANDVPGREKPSAIGKWFRAAFITMLFAGGSAAATVAWERHGDTARQMLAEWTPALASVLPSTSQTVPVAAAQAAAPAAQDQTADQSAVQNATAATQADATPSLESITRDMTAMAQQIEQLKANIAELKAGQEQMVREMAKPPAPKPVAEARPPVDPRARVSALPPRAPAPMPPPVRKPKPVVSQTYMPAYSPAPLAPPPPSQAAAVPPPAAPPTATAQSVADDD